MLAGACFYSQSMRAAGELGEKWTESHGVALGAPESSTQKKHAGQLKGSALRLEQLRFARHSLAKHVQLKFFGPFSARARLFSNEIGRSAACRISPEEQHPGSLTFHIRAYHGSHSPAAWRRNETNL